MWTRVFTGLALAALCQAQPATLSSNARRFLADLVRIDTTNPPGNETSAAKYLKQVADAEGIPSELLGADPARLNFVARLRGSGQARPLLLMAHTDVVPADRTQWTVDAFSGEIRGDFLYGRGTQDDKNLLAAELAVLIELKRRGVPLKRDVILLAESDEEAGSTGVQWLTANAWEKIDAEFAINEGGFAMDASNGSRVFQIQTAEKIPTRLVLTAHGTAGHGSLPRPDNPVVHLSRAIVRLADSDQPVRLNTTTSRYLTEIAKLPDYRWLNPLLARLEDRTASATTANQIRARDPELDAMLRTSISPTILQAGIKINVIPNVAQAQIDVRRLPNETREEVIARFRAIVNDPAVEIAPAPGQEMPPTEPSSMTTALYQSMTRVFARSVQRAVIVPYMSRGATDGAFLRQKGMAVYGVPIFARAANEDRLHGNDERISLQSFDAGVDLLRQILLDVAGEH